MNWIILSTIWDTRQATPIHNIRKSHCIQQLPIFRNHDFVVAQAVFARLFSICMLYISVPDQFSLWRSHYLLQPKFLPQCRLPNCRIEQELVWALVPVQDSFNEAWWLAFPVLEISLPNLGPDFTPTKKILFISCQQHKQIEPLLILGEESWHWCKSYIPVHQTNTSPTYCFFTPN